MWRCSSAGVGGAADVLVRSPVRGSGEELVVGVVEELVHLGSVATSGTALGCTISYPCWNGLTKLITAL